MVDSIHARVRVNAPTVIHETIDGEVIVIHLKTGTYYSVRGTGVDVWGAVDVSPGSSASEIVAAFASRFDSSPQEMLPPVTKFLAELGAEDLVIGVAQADGHADADSDADRNGSPLQAFTPPVLEKYTDMTDLVLLDPVHEVDPTGWPQPRPEQSPAGGAT